MKKHTIIAIFRKSIHIYWDCEYSIDMIDTIKRSADLEEIIDTATGETIYRKA